MVKRKQSQDMAFLIMERWLDFCEDIVSFYLLSLTLIRWKVLGIGLLTFKLIFCLVTWANSRIKMGRLNEIEVGL